MTLPGTTLDIWLCIGNYSNVQISGLIISISGNGVVIHLPGLFDEAEKNMQKGKGIAFHLSP